MWTWEKASCVDSNTQGLLALGAGWWELPRSVPRGLASQEAH